MNIRAGSCREKTPDVWELRISLGKDPATGKYRNLYKTFHGSEAQAVRALKKLRQETMAVGGAPPKLSVGELLEVHLADLRLEGRSVTTIAEYRRLVDKVINPALGGLPIAQLTVGRLDRLYTTELARGQAPSSVRQIHAILSGALTRAVKKGWLFDNVARRATIPAKPRTHVEAPPPESVRRLVVAALQHEPAERGLFLRLAAVTGLRRGELCGLRWSDLDADSLLVARNVVVAKAADLDAGLPSSGRLKTRYVIVKSLKVDRPRRIALDADTSLALAVHRGLMEARAELFSTRLAPSAYIFSDDPDQARPWYPPIMSETVQRIKRAAGISEARLLHGLRHYAATELLAAGIDAEVGAARLGHTSTKTFLDVYAHARAARDRAAADILGATFHT